MSMLLNELIKQGLVSQEQINDARTKQAAAKKPLHELLVEMGYITEERLIQIAASAFKMETADLDKEAIDPDPIRFIPYEKAKQYGVFPLRQDNDALVVAMSDPQDVIARDSIQALTKLRLRPILCSKSVIAQAIEKYYQSDEKIYSILKNTSADITLKRVKKPAQTMLAQSLESEDAPIVRLCNMIIGDAVRARASDIHIEVQEESIKIRYRIDGDLKNVMDLPATVHDAVVARIKVLSDLNIAETRKPQDGRIKIMINDKKVDLRVSTIPVFLGEKVEIRILDPEEAKISLDKIGLVERELKILREAFAKPQGMILVTGPTGSGKTSTLYAALNYVKSEAKNIVTIEDPIEYLIEGINQMQINPAKDVTFSTGLSHILRQDPNVILVGEIRDRETAEIAFQSSQTGHLVFSTVHSNNATATITRLLDIGLQPYIIASSLILIVAQRLIKVICPFCRERYVPDTKLTQDFKKYIDQFGIKEFYHGKGCAKCGYTGYYGRTAIFEIMQVNDAIKALIAEGADEGKILLAAMENGLKTLVYAGMEKVLAGVTTLEEVCRVAGVKEEDKIIQRSKSSGQKLKLLVTDDEEDILKVLSVLLKGAGYEIIVARDGSEAVEMARREKPDLIIIDVTMPKMNGFEAVKELRSRLETVAVPIIMLTARSDKESELKGLEGGADDFIAKPFDGDKLLARVKLLLKRKETRA